MFMLHHVNGRLCVWRLHRVLPSGSFAGDGAFREGVSRGMGLCVMPPQIAKFMGPTWGPPGSFRSQMGPMLAPRTLLSGTASLWTCFGRQAHIPTGQGSTAHCRGRACLQTWTSLNMYGALSPHWSLWWKFSLQPPMTSDNVPMPFGKTFPGLHTEPGPKLPTSCPSYYLPEWRVTKWGLYQNFCFLSLVCCRWVNAFVFFSYMLINMFSGIIYCETIKFSCHYHQLNNNIAIRYPRSVPTAP